MSTIPKASLEKLYVREGKSMKQIATLNKCSVNKIRYWLDKHDITRRSISDAIYQWHNPHGDPFSYRPPKTTAEHRLFGMGLGLYWGEGTKADKVSIRLGNTDPALLNTFLAFLERFFGIKRGHCTFGLQLFNDLEPKEALDFWTKKLKIHRLQFYKTTVTPSVARGTYRRKNRYGVLTIYYNNRKARDVLMALLRDYGYAPPETQLVLPAKNTPL